jgi:hypothetical protein
MDDRQARRRTRRAGVRVAWPAAAVAPVAAAGLALALAVAVTGAPARGQGAGQAEKAETPAPAEQAPEKKPTAPKKTEKAKPLPPPSHKVPADAPSRFPTDM